MVKNIFQWPFQEPIDWRYLPYVRPIFKAYVRGYTPKIWPYMVQYLHFRILEFPLNIAGKIPYTTISYTISYPQIPTFKRLQGGQKCHGGAPVVCLFQYKVMRYAHHLQ